MMNRQHSDANPSSPPSTRAPAQPSRWLICCLWLLAATAVGATQIAPTVQSEHTIQPQAAADNGTLQQDIESLKQSVLELNRDLLILEEELLFPTNTQLMLFVSMDVGAYFRLDAVEVKVDQNLVASHLYTERQIDALFRGGIQRLHTGNLRAGSHRLTAFFTGFGPAGREIKRGASINVEKGQKPILLELRIVDSTAKMQPVFELKQWEL